MVASFKILLSRQCNCGNERNKEVGWKESKDGGVVISYKTKGSEGNGKQGDTLLSDTSTATKVHLLSRSRITRYKPTVKTSLLPFTSIHLVQRKIPHDAMFSFTACFADKPSLVQSEDDDVRLSDRKDKVIQ